MIWLYWYLFVGVITASILAIYFYKQGTYKNEILLSDIFMPILAGVLWPLAALVAFANADETVIWRRKK